jgi:hypothetical protein
MTSERYKTIKRETGDILNTLRSLDKSRFTSNLVRVLNDIDIILTAKLATLTNMVHAWLPVEVPSILKTVIEISLKQYHERIGFNPINHHPSIFVIQQTHTNIAALLISNVLSKTDYIEAYKVVYDFLKNPFSPLLNFLIADNLKKALPLPTNYFNSKMQNENISPNTAMARMS